MNELANSSVIARLRTGFEEKKRKIRSEWRGETIALNRSLKLQNKIESYTSPDQAKKDAKESLDIYGKMFLRDPKQKEPTDKEIYQAFINLSEKKGPPDFEELEIKTDFLSSLDEKNENFRKKTLDYIERESQDILLSTLFYSAREFGSKPFDKEKELRQIRAVQHLLMGDHVAMVTGDGKTSVVIPIFSVAQTLFSQDNGNGLPALIASSADINLTQEIKKNIQKFSNITTSVVDSNPILKFQLDQRLKTLSLNMELTQDTREKDSLAGYFSQNPDQFAWEMVNGVRISARSQDQVIFDTTELYVRELEQKLAERPREDRKKIIEEITKNFKERMPLTIIDEAHLLNQSPYITDTGRHEEQGKTRISLEDPSDMITIIEYISLRLAQEIILPDGKNITYTNQRGEISSSGHKSIKALREKIVNDITSYQGDKRKQNKLILRIKKIINTEVSNACEFEGNNFSEVILDKLANFWSDSPKSPLKMLEEDNIDEGGVKDSLKKREKILFSDQYYSELFGEFIKTTTTIKKGVHYLDPDTLRDEIRGNLLKGRRFSGDVPFYLNLQEGKLLIRNKSQVFNKINFCTWLRLIGQDNILALSNDLYYTDPLNGERELSPLGEMLEKYSDGYVVDLAPRETYPVHDPFIAKNKSHLLENVKVDILKRFSGDKKRPELITCWDETFGANLYQDLSNSDLKVGFITSNTSDKEADEYQRQLSNYEIDVLITTGRKSFAADFKDKNDKYTDLRVNVINPETVFQVAQAFGRRRMDKNEGDFSIYFDKEFILDMATVLAQEDKSSLFFKQLFNIENPVFPEVENLINKAARVKNLKDNDREKLKKDIFEVLRRNQRKYTGDWERESEFEKAFIQDIAPIIKQTKQDLIESNWRKAYSPMHKIIEEEIESALAKTNLGELPFKNKKDLEIATQQTAYNFFSSIEENVYRDFQNLITTGQNDPIVKGNIETLKDSVIRKMEDNIKNAYMPFWKDQLTKPEGTYLQRDLRRELQESLEININFLEFVKNQLRPVNLGLKDIAITYTLVSPIFQHDRRNNFVFGNPPISTAVISTCNNQKIFVYNDRRYLLDKNSMVYVPVNTDFFERQLSSLNGFQEYPFSEGNFLDIFYQSDDTRRFVRIKLKEKDK